MPELRPDTGFTMIELMWTLVIAGLLLTIGVFGFTSYHKAQAHRGTATSLAEGLRNAQTRAQADGNRMCVHIDQVAGTWTTFRSPSGTNCTSGTRVAQARVGDGDVYLGMAGFRQFNGVMASDVWFLPRGIATGGSVQVTRAGSGTTYRIDVEGLTSRVSVDK